MEETMAKKSKSKKAKTTKKTTGNGRIPDTAKIKLLKKGNARRPGTQAHARFALYKNDMTVAAYIAAGEKSGTRTSRGNVAADLKRGNIKLQMPNAKGSV